MRSKPLRAPLRLLIPLSITLALSGCAGMPRMPMILAALDCASVIPASYRKPVTPTPLPAADANVGGLWIALDGQTGKLDQANGRTADVVAMADTCQAHQVKVAAELTKRPWWRFW